MGHFIMSVNRMARIFAKPGLGASAHTFINVPDCEIARSNNPFDIGDIM
jgi:hypothetical protein